MHMEKIISPTYSNFCSQKHLHAHGENPVTFSGDGFPLETPPCTWRKLSSRGSTIISFRNTSMHMEKIVRLTNS